MMKLLIPFKSFA